MAKNWKRAHDAQLHKATELEGKLYIANTELANERARRSTAESNLSIACNHMEAAADQLLVRQAASTAGLLRREADRLYPYKAMAATKNAERA